MVGLPWQPLSRLFYDIPLTSASLTDSFSSGTITTVQTRLTCRQIAVGGREEGLYVDRQPEMRWKRNTAEERKPEEERDDRGACERREIN